MFVNGLLCPIISHYRVVIEFLDHGWILSESKEQGRLKGQRVEGTLDTGRTPVSEKARRVSQNSNWGSCEIPLGMPWLDH